ncbi:MAG: recombination mediator RecR [Alphaproteobacteria bacterium]
MSTPELERLADLLAKLPGLGPRSARRAVLHLIKRPGALMQPLAEALSGVVNAIRTCSACANVDTVDPCRICADYERDRSVICVIEDVADLWALERTASYGGLYHVLGGTLSALDGVGPGDLRIGVLVDRARSPEVKEVILATNATVAGQTTAHYITERLADAGVLISRLAHGVPVGGELDYLDDGTLTAAIKSRREV